MLNSTRFKQPLAITLLLLGLISCAEPRQSVKPGINERFKGDFAVGPWVERFESESREVFDHRQAIMSAVNAQPGADIADIGAGTGFYTFMFADSVGPTGTVYAVDIARPFVDHIAQRAVERNQSQINPIRCAEDDANLPRASIDKAFICDTYHHFEYPNATMDSIAQAMRPGGDLYVIEFRRYAEGEGTDDAKWMALPQERREWIRGHVRCDRATIIREIEVAGFQYDDDFAPDCNDLMAENYLMRFTRNDS